jgi:hypothetical protein
VDANTRKQQYEAVKNLGDCQKLFWMDEICPYSCIPMHQTTDAEHISSRKIVTEKYPIQFLSKSFSPVQKRWSTIEQEAYAILYVSTNLNTSCVTVHASHRSP